MYPVIRQKSTGATFPIETHGGLPGEKPDQYVRYFIGDPGDPPFNHYTGIPLGEEGADPQEGAPATGDGHNDITYEQREALILEAVVNIAVENYGKPAAGRPALPRKAAVESLTKFKVTLDEIQKAVATKELLGLESPLPPEETQTPPAEDGNYQGDE